MINVTSLRLPGIQDDNWMNLALGGGKNNTRNLKRLCPIIQHEYSGYDTIIRQYQKKPNKSRFEKHRDLLKKFYGKAPTDLNKLIVERRNSHEYEQCPFCGRPCVPSILDHFIPKDKWPEYAIYPNNLVNQCDTCSTKKGEKYFSEKDKSAKYIHPIYFDLLSKVEFEYTIHIANPANMKVVDISLDIIIPKYYGVKKTKRVELHLSSLEVKEYALLHADKTYLRWLRKAEKKKADILSILENYIKLETKKIDNDWDICLYKAMLNNPTIVSYFTRATP